MTDDLILKGKLDRLSLLDVLVMIFCIKCDGKLILDKDSYIVFKNSKPVFASSGCTEGLESLKEILEKTWEEFRLTELKEDVIPNLICDSHFLISYREKNFPNEMRMNLADTGKELSKNYLSMLEFYSKLIHELSNPLTIIKGNVQLSERHVAQNRKVPREVQESIKQMEEKVSKQVARMTKLIGSAKKLSKPSSRKEVIYDVKILLDEWIETCEFSKNKDIQLYYSNESKEAKIYGEPDELIQAISNILENSMQACLLSDKRPCVIVLYMTNSESHLLINITDNGVGIDKERMEDIFEPFFSTYPEGFGLGLNVVKAIIDGMSGEIEIKSNKGSGTEVTITLPLMK